MTVSIIVPVYNTKEYIETCINSILNQTYKNLEIIIVDAAFAGVGVLDYGGRSQCAFSNAHVRFYQAGGNLPQCAGVKPCLAGKPPHGWGVPDGQLGGFCHAAAYGYLFSYVYPAGGLWSAA